jgi:benzoyl-CoA reductase subunit D
MVGGVALNQGFVESLRRDLGKDVKVPEDPDFIGALGAALAAAAGVFGEEVTARVVEKDKFAEGKA